MVWSRAEIINLITAIGTVMAAIVALFIAVFQDRMRTWFMRPKLEVSTDLCPPDCHKTRYHLTVQRGYATRAATTTLYPHTEGAADAPLTTTTTITSGSSQAFTADQEGRPVTSRSADAYYLRLRVQNSGKRKAESIEVFAAGLEKRQADGTFSSVGSFLPMNLLWSHYRQVFLPTISPETYKHCDLAYIIDPKERENFPGEHKTWPNIPSEKTVLSFDTVVKPDTQSYLVPMGTYRLSIIVAAANVKSIEKRLEIRLTGDWYDDEREILTQGIGIREL